MHKVNACIIDALNFILFYNSIGVAKLALKSNKLLELCSEVRNPI